MKIDGLILVDSTGKELHEGDIIENTKGELWVLKGLSRGRMFPKIVARPKSEPSGFGREFYPSVFKDVTFLEEKK